MKVFRLAKAELYKLLQRPALYIITGVLVIALAVFAVFYSPQRSTSSLSTYTGTMTEINTQFEERKTRFDNNLNQKIQEIEENYYKITNTTPKLNETKNNYELIVARQNSLNSAVIALSSSEDLTSAKNALTSLKEQILTARNSLQSLNTEIDFYLTRSDYDSYYSFLDSYYSQIPTVAQLTNYNKTAIISLSNTLSTNYNINERAEFINSLKAFELDQEEVDEYLEKFGYSLAYSTDGQSVLNTLYAEITEFYSQNISSQEDSVKEQFIEKLELYESLSLAGQRGLDYSFTLSITSGLTDSYSSSLIGFESVNTYSLKEQVLTYSFEIDNLLSQDSYSRSPAFFSTSTSNPTAYDFTITAMRILSIIIIIACVFFASGMIAGESSQGTLKMLAIRPYSRNKILLGKFIACIEFLLLLLFISTLATFIVGGCMFGFGSAEVLLIFNASSLALVHPICLVLIYMLAIILEASFFISLSLLASTLIRSGTISVVGSFAIYLVTLLINIFAGSAVWAKFLPSTHANLYGFFGGVSNSVSAMGFFVTADANFFVSLSITLVSSFLMLALSLVIFRKRDIS